MKYFLSKGLNVETNLFRILLSRTLYNSGVNGVPSQKLTTENCDNLHVACTPEINKSVGPRYVPDRPDTTIVDFSVSVL